MITVGKLGIVRCTGPDLTALRVACFERDGFRCVHCGQGVLWHTGHMMHIKSRGSGGPDVLANVETGCAKCHGESHNCGGKPVPRK